MTRTTRSKALAVAALAMAPLLSLTACGADMSDPDSVAKAYAQALLLDRDCEAAAEFVDEDEQDYFTGDDAECDSDDILGDIEFGDDEDFESDTDEGYAEVEIPITYDDGEEEETFYVYLEENGNEEWEVVASDDAPSA